MTKPPLILVHGFRGSPIGLKSIADLLTKSGYEVHVPAIPPFAGSKLPDSRTSYSAEAYAEYLANYIKAHHLKKPILIGHSMGSIIVAATAEKYPDLINEKLILMSPISVKPAKFFAALTPLSALLPNRLVDYITTRFLFVPKDHQLFKQTMQLTHACSYDQPPTKSAVFSAAKFSARHSIDDFAFQKDTLLLAGEHDKLIPLSKTENLKSKLKCQLKIIPDSGHLHNYESPEATAAAIIDFIS